MTACGSTMIAIAWILGLCASRESNLSQRHFSNLAVPNIQRTASCLLSTLSSAISLARLKNPGACGAKPKQVTPRSGRRCLFRPKLSSHFLPSSSLIFIFVHTEGQTYGHFYGLFRIRSLVWLISLPVSCPTTYQEAALERVALRAPCRHGWLTG